MMKRFTLLLVLTFSALATNAVAAPGAPVTGTVTSSADGAPLGSVCVGAQADPYVPGGYGFAVTEADGTFALDLTPGRYVVSFEDCDEASPLYFGEYHDDARSWQEATRVVVPPTGVEGLDAALDPEAVIDGTVRDAYGAPIAGVCVHAEGGSWYGEASTGEDGTYRITSLAADVYRIRFSGGCAGPFLVEYYDDASDWNAATPVGVAPGDVVRGIDAVLDRTPRSGTGAEGISGVVVSENGRPVWGAWVDVWRRTPAGTYRYAATIDADGDGVYEIDLEAGTYKLSAADVQSGGHLPEFYDDAATLAEATPVEVVAGSFSRVDFELAPVPPGDVSISIARIENVPLRTDAGDLPVGTGMTRRIVLRIVNDSDSSVWTYGGGILVCPATYGGCHWLTDLDLSLPAGATKQVEIDWNATGYAGDVRVSAFLGEIWGVRDGEYDDNSDHRTHYVLVGGTGHGVGRAP